MVEAGCGGAAALRSLVPSHGERVERVQVTEDRLGALAAEDNDAGARKHRRVSVASGGRSARNLGFDPAGAVNVQNVRIVQVGEASIAALIEVTPEDD